TNHKKLICLSGISFEGFFKDDKRSAQIFFIEDISHSHFLFALSFGNVKTTSRGEHYGFIFKAERFKQPLAKSVGIVDRQLRHAVESTARFWAKYSRNFIQTVNQKIPAT